MFQAIFFVFFIKPVFSNSTFLIYSNETSLFFDLNSTEIYNSTLSYCQVFWIRCLSISLIFGVLILCTIIGNAFVIAAVVLDRNLNNVGNHLIFLFSFFFMIIGEYYFFS